MANKLQLYTKLCSYAFHVRKLHFSFSIAWFRVLRCLIILVILHCRASVGIFLPCRFSRGKIPDYELGEIIQLVFGDIFVCYIYFLLPVRRQCLAMNERARKR